MSTEVVKKSSVKEIFTREDVQKRFTDMLGKKAQGFMTSVLQIVASNDLLSKADPLSVYNAAAVAATLDLPINNNLGFAYIIPYNSKQKNGSMKTVAQFQLGYKGFVQLAQRSGQFQTISSKPVYEGQIVEDNSFEGFHFNWANKTSDKVIGYAAYFSLLNGFEKVLYMSKDEISNHGKTYSQTFKKGFGMWKDNFDAMAQKTVLKLLLAKFAPLSIEMQRAVITDQSVVNDYETEDVSYVDNEAITPELIAIEKERERIINHIENAKTKEQLLQVQDHISEEDDQLFDLFTLKLKAF